MSPKQKCYGYKKIMDWFTAVMIITAQDIKEGQNVWQSIGGLHRFIFCENLYYLWFIFWLLSPEISPLLLV